MDSKSQFSFLSKKNRWISTHKDSHPLTYPCSTFTNNHDKNMIYQPISNRFSRGPTCYRATQQPMEAPVLQVRSSPAARAALMNSVRQGDLISALEEEDSGDGGFGGSPFAGPNLPVNRCVLFLGENQIVWKEKLMFQISFGGSHIFGRRLVFWWWGWDFEWVGICPDDRTSGGLVTSCSLDHWVSQTSQSVDGCVVLFLAIVLMGCILFFFTQ